MGASGGFPIRSLNRKNRPSIQTYGCPPERRINGKGVVIQPKVKA
jgi:hypothetical protein